ncbi:hypothetical protein L3V79_05235 [Thiotrichales bacterium 19S9-12]|nr:hypothetical protein [Thiotrichales bacterium 19S9-11]MCF6811762.1 hypothetical protein [Thiotrichales bacterium 19S9-12]
MKKDTGIDQLILLDGTTYFDENGYWYKIEAHFVKPTKERPHGVRYNLTLHDKYNRRILGFDNAHAVTRGKQLKGRIIEYDHMHRNSFDKGTPYHFTSAYQLLKDFFERVNKIIEESKRRER